MQCLLDTFDKKTQRYKISSSRETNCWPLTFVVRSFEHRVIGSVCWLHGRSSYPLLMGSSLPVAVS